MDSDKRLIDFWLQELEKPELPYPEPEGILPPRLNLAQSSFFGWIMYLMLLLILMIPGPSPAALAQNIEMPDSWTAPSRTVIYQDCCCDSNTVLLNQIYNNQESSGDYYAPRSGHVVGDLRYIKIQNRPSTIQGIHEKYFKSSSNLNISGD